MVLAEWCDGHWVAAIREGKSREEAFDEIQSENDSLEPDLEWHPHATARGTRACMRTRAHERMRALTHAELAGM